MGAGDCKGEILKMSDSELTRFAKELKKIADSDTPVSDSAYVLFNFDYRISKNTEMAMDVLVSLQNLPVTQEGLHVSNSVCRGGITVTISTLYLKRSRACSLVRKVLKKCGGKKLAPVAAGLLKSWKRLSDPSAKHKKMVETANRNGKRETVSSSSSPSSSPRTSVSAGRIEESIYCIDSIVREKSINLLSNVLSKDSSNGKLHSTCIGSLEYIKHAQSGHWVVCICHPAADKNRIRNLATLIEELIFSEFNDTGNKYKMRIRSRVANLGDAKNPNLRQKVLSGEITAAQISTMTAEVGANIK